jgi:hypothetical protein
VKFDINKYRDFFIAADTDSAIFTFEPLLIKSFGEDYKSKLTDDKILIECKKYIKKYSEKLNNEYLNKLSKNKFNIDKHKFNWKTENILRSALWTGKRRYAQYIIEKEGVPVNELDTKGLELQKSNSNPIFKKFGEQFIKDILFGKPKIELDKSIIDFYNYIKETDPIIIGKPSGVSFINKCIKRKPGPGEIFSEFNINTKENSKAAIIYNDLLKFKKLDKKYESIIEGDKIFVFNLVNNPYHIDVIGIPNGKIPPEIDEFIKKYTDYEQLFESSILNKLKELYNDLGWKDSFPSLNSRINKFFKF